MRPLENTMWAWDLKLEILAATSGEWMQLICKIRTTFQLPRQIASKGRASATFSPPPEIIFVKRVSWHSADASPPLCENKIGDFRGQHGERKCAQHLSISNQRWVALYCAPQCQPTHAIVSILADKLQPFGTV